MDERGCRFLMNRLESLFVLNEDVAEQVYFAVQKQLSEFFIQTKRRVLILAGPTGVGKTALSLLLARLLGGEIISADSIQVYRGMDIGTAKVSLHERELVAHHLIDIRTLEDPFNVFDFVKEAQTAIDSILARGKVPIVVGGTGFYLHALLYGPPQGPPADDKVRSFIRDELKEKGLAHLYDRLVELDPDYAKTISASDEHKISRALEIIQLSGRKVSDFSWKNRPLISSYEYHAWFLHMPKELLYKRLNERCELMLKEGLLHEVMQLETCGLRKNSTAAHAIGYRQSLAFLDTEKTPDDYASYVEQLKAASRQLAKRQYTWFRKEPAFRWLDVTTMSQEALMKMIAEDYFSVLA